MCSKKGSVWNLKNFSPETNLSQYQQYRSKDGFPSMHMNIIQGD